MVVSRRTQDSRPAYFALQRWLESIRRGELAVPPTHRDWSLQCILGSLRFLTERLNARRLASAATPAPPRALGGPAPARPGSSQSASARPSRRPPAAACSWAASTLAIRSAPLPLRGEQREGIRLAGHITATTRVPWRRPASSAQLRSPCTQRCVLRRSSGASLPARPCGASNPSCSTPSGGPLSLTASVECVPSLRQQVHGEEPDGERQLSGLEYGARPQGDLPLAMVALVGGPAEAEAAGPVTAVGGAGEAGGLAGLEGDGGGPCQRWWV